MNRLPFDPKHINLNPIIEAINFLLDKEAERQEKVDRMANARAAKSSASKKSR